MPLLFITSHAPCRAGVELCHPYTTTVHIFFPLGHAQAASLNTVMYRKASPTYVVMNNLTS